MVVLYLERNREYNNRALGSTLKQIHDGVDAAVEATVVGPVEQQKWPAQPKAQLAVIRNLLRTTPSDWIVKQIAAQFNGRTTQKKLDAITENLERLEWFGLVISETRDGLTCWYDGDTAQVA